MKKEIRYFGELAEKFKTLGHPIRLSIIHMLCNCGCQKLQVKAIYEELNIDQSSISRHLNIMRRSGILERIQEGNNTFYSLCSNDAHVNCVKKCFME
ncbi:MAG: ArsR/SmtB family transcription factor [Flavobacteriales bacterium]